VIAHVVICTGWTFEYVGNHVDLPRLRSLNRMWEEYPPAHVSLAFLAGTNKKKSKEVKPQEEEKSFEELMASMPRIPMPKPAATPRSE
jgi:hypothetical protein